MKNYLICNTQDIVDFNGNTLGKRVCDISETTFLVSEEYEWKQFSETLNIYNGIWYWSNEKPEEYIPINTAEQNKQFAMIKLSEVDWVNQPDVIDTSLTPHLLNHSEFIAYRSALRAIAVNPIDGNLDWPVKPQEQWSS